MNRVKLLFQKTLWIFLIAINWGGIEAIAKPLIYVIDLKKEIGTTTWIYVKEGFAEAQALKADHIIIDMNTYGGAVLDADSIRTLIMNSRVPVYAFINNNAASAGALIAIACDSIYMRTGSSMGAATVVNGSGEVLPDKYQSYMRSTIRSTAESHGKITIINNGDTIERWRRDPLIAEAMVDPRTVVRGLIDSSRVLTFTPTEAIAYGYCEGITESIDELILTQLNIPQYELKEYKPTWYDDIRGILFSPALQAILILIIVGGIYFELQTPGIGFPLIASITAGVLYFAPLYFEGLAANWEIILFIIGVGLLIAEVFFIPGFGIAGIGGIILMISTLFLALVDNVIFDFTGVSSESASTAALTVTLALLGSVSLLLYISSKIGTKGMFRKIALTEQLDEEHGFAPVNAENRQMIGSAGIAVTDLRPSGKIEIHGEIFDAISMQGFIAEGTEIVVKKVEQTQLFVKAISKTVQHSSK